MCLCVFGSGLVQVKPLGAAGDEAQGPQSSSQLLSPLCDGTPPYRSPSHLHQPGNNQGYHLEGTHRHPHSCHRESPEARAKDQRSECRGPTGPRAGSQVSRVVFPTTHTTLDFFVIIKGKGQLSGKWCCLTHLTVIR